MFLNVVEPSERAVFRSAQGGVPIGNGGWNSLKELWCLDIQANSWTNFTQSDGPGPRHNHVAVLASAQGSRGTMWIHGHLPWWPVHLNKQHAKIVEAWFGLTMRLSHRFVCA